MKGCPEGSESTYLHLHLLNEPGLMNQTNKVSSFNIIHIWSLAAWPAQEDVESRMSERHRISSLYS